MLYSILLYHTNSDLDDCVLSLIRLRVLQKYVLKIALSRIYVVLEETPLSLCCVALHWGLLV